MDYLTHETASSIFKYLLDSGCCLSCCLRLVGTRTVEYFQDPIGTATKLNYISKDDQISNEEPCISCIGILQNDVQEETLKQIFEAVKNSGYDSLTFTCALSLPISLQPRERSIYIAIAKKFDLSENQLCHLKLKTWGVKDVWKAQMLHKVEKECSLQYVSAPVPSPFSLDISLVNNDDENKYIEALKKCDPKFLESRNKWNQKKVVYSRNNIEGVLLNIAEKSFVNFFNIPAKKPSKSVTIEKVGCSHASIYIGGRYIKLSRELSQTPWFIKGEKKMESSVQDLICGPIVEYTKAKSLKLLSSGREDVNVRTINSGRPFAVELLDPKVTKISAEEFKKIVETINSSTKLVQISSTLQILGNSELKRLKEGENQKSKFYRALCTSRSKPVDPLNLSRLELIKDLEIIQKTPVRVLHRRPLASRPRIIHSIRGRLLTSEETEELSNRAPENILKNLFILDVKTQAGTYVKEFVYGDFGRTKPNLCELLGQEVDIVALDVTGINLHWP